MLWYLASLQVCTTQRDALLSIRNQTNPDSWIALANWGSNLSVCEWERVECNAGGFVVGLNLSGVGLQGAIPDNITCLPFLKSLYLNDNAINAAFPADVCDLVALQYLQINNAGLTGNIPDCICNMNFTKYLYLENNSLDGAIPTCVGNMTELMEIHLTCNELEGTIPTGFNTLPHLTEVRFNCNDNLDCTSELATRPNFIFVCGDVDCENCTHINPSQCPHSVDVPGCGTYYSPIYSF